MHSRSKGSRIFVPPFTDPYDPNFIRSSRRDRLPSGRHGDRARGEERGRGVERAVRSLDPARQYMVYHGSTHPYRIATQTSRTVRERPVRTARSTAGNRGTFRCPIVRRMAFAADRRLRCHRAAPDVTRREVPHHLARELLQGARRMGEPQGRPVPFVIRPPARSVRDIELLDILRIGRWRSIRRRPRLPPATSRIQPARGLRTAQPYGAFAKTLLEKQIYPDSACPGGPPKPPYDVTGHTLWMLMGVEVDAVDDRSSHAARAERCCHRHRPCRRRNGPI